jgi:acetyl-CoA/propionyl-CoA carboxylase biotin carboxyl carrier protein
VHSTKWVEERLDLSGVSSAPAAPATVEGEEPKVRRDVDVEVNGKRFAVSMWVPESAMSAGPGPSAGARRPRAVSNAGLATVGSGSVTVPMQGTIVKVLVAVGDHVEAGQAVCVLEAMKMENHINAETSGEVKEVRVEAGQAVSSGDVVVVIA